MEPLRILFLAAAAASMVACGAPPPSGQADEEAEAAAASASARRDAAAPGAADRDPRRPAANGAGATAAVAEAEARADVAGPAQTSRPARDEAASQPSYAHPSVAAPPASVSPQFLARLPGPQESPPPQLSMASPGCCPTWPTEDLDRERYAHYDDNPLRLAAESPVSTFSIDVDTGAYSNVRRMLRAGRLPPHDAVRVEELINYFAYDYPTPADDEPFRVSTQIAPTPWNTGTLLLQIGLAGAAVEAAQRPPANLVFLVDVSGSMRSPAKLPLLRDALKMLALELDERDSVAIVGYAGGAGVVLEPTGGDDRRAVLDSLVRLRAGGATNGAAGILTAYAMARRQYVDGAINRVILATDGDFNVGTVDFESLLSLVEEQRESGISLTALGFGTGNYNDHLLERLADAGDGNYAYIDTRREAHKVLVTQMASTLQIIARDVKVQIEFNPTAVAEYRLIGYENRVLRREDFNNDAVDAGEIGAGHRVTALYEITLTGSPARLIEPLRYATAPGADAGPASELAHVRLRYRLPQAGRSRLIARPVRADEVLDPADTTDDWRFAAAVAAFGQRLRGGSYLGGFDFGEVLTLAEGAVGADRHGYRNEFVALAGLARSLTARVDAAPGRQAVRVAD